MTDKIVDKRLAALRRFAFSITAFTVLGGFVLHFEDTWAQPVVAVASCYALDLVLETIEALGAGRSPRYGGGPRALVDFLLPAHITGLSIALLLYPNERLGPIVLACAVAQGSKYILRAPVGNGWRHFLNPSNAGIVAVLLLFPWVGISPPYQFTEGVMGIWGAAVLGWALPALVLLSGTAINVMLTGKLPLIVGWLGGFVLQGLGRALVFGTPLAAPLMPMTGLVFVLYTNYMITDPGTTPIGRRNQAVFGAATAVVYGLLVSAHVVFGLFFALAIVCACRGLLLYAVTVRAFLRQPGAVAARATP
jgi:enediyne biosynthesis protein E5